jgi:hypothetical protein
MEEKNKLFWAVPAYEHKEKNVDWFWALGIIIFAGTITSFIYENYFFAGVLLVGGILMGYFAQKEPETLYYELNENGIKIKDQLYPYKNIKSFWVATEKKPTLFIKTSRFFLPTIMLTINNNVADKIKKILIDQEIPEEEMKEPMADALMDFIGY